MDIDLFFLKTECCFTLPMLGDKHIFSAWEPLVPSPSEVLATLRPAPRQGTGSQQASLQRTMVLSKLLWLCNAGDTISMDS